MRVHNFNTHVLFIIVLCTIHSFSLLCSDAYSLMHTQNRSSKNLPAYIIDFQSDQEETYTHIKHHTPVSFGLHIYASNAPMKKDGIIHLGYSANAAYYTFNTSVECTIIPLIKFLHITTEKDTSCACFIPYSVKKIFIHATDTSAVTIYKDETTKIEYDVLCDTHATVHFFTLAKTLLLRCTTGRGTYFPVTEVRKPLTE